MKDDDLNDKLAAALDRIKALEGYLSEVHLDDVSSWSAEKIKEETKSFIKAWEEDEKCPF